MEKYSKEDIAGIWKRYIANTCSEEERSLVERWHLDKLANDDFQPDEKEIEHASKRFYKSEEEYHGQSRMIKIKHTQRWIAAACAGIFMGLSVLYYNGTIFRQEKELQIGQSDLGLDVRKMDLSIAPGMDKAMLRLADGTVLSLEDLNINEPKTIDDVKLSKNEDGSVSYELSASSDKEKPFHFNEITTPRGGQFQVTLPDGTKVWLNAMSTLRVSSSASTMRKVKLEGEAYFEVKKDLSSPFIVNVNNHDIIVHGTHFNVHAYGDENHTKTTLLEGSIEIVKNSKGKETEKKMLMPGQEAVIPISSSGHITVQSANGENTIAWKKGYFNFENTTLPDLMKQLERWYDIHTVYEGTTEEHAYVGQIARKANLLDVLKILHLSGLNIKIVDRTLHISDNP